MNKKYLLLLSFAFLLAEFSSAQTFDLHNRDRNLIIGGGVGLTTYYGDLDNPENIIDLNLNLSVNVKHRVGNHLFLGADLTYYRLSGDDRENKIRSRNLRFVSDNVEIIGYLMVDLIRRPARFYQRSLLNPYIYFGFGATYFNPRTDYAGETYSLRKYETNGESYGIIAPVAPVGLGVKLKVTHFFNILLDASYRFAFTDYLDDVAKREYIINSNQNYEPIPGINNDIRLNLIYRAHQTDDNAKYTEQEVLDHHVDGIRAGSYNDGYLLYSVKVEYYISPGIFGVSKGDASYHHKRRR